MSQSIRSVYYINMCITTPAIRVLDTTCTQPVPRLRPLRRSKTPPLAKTDPRDERNAQCVASW